MNDPSEVMRSTFIFKFCTNRVHRKAKSTKVKIMFCCSGIHKARKEKEPLRKAHSSSTPSRSALVLVTPAAGLSWGAACCSHRWGNPTSHRRRLLWLGELVLPVPGLCRRTINVCLSFPVVRLVLRKSVEFVMDAQWCSKPL